LQTVAKPREDTVRAVRVACLVLLLLGGGGFAAARPAQGQRVPRRPKLPAQADTNSANAYYQFGANVLWDKPRDAANAFYWAHEIIPDWPDPLYGRWVAMLLDRATQLPAYLEGNRRVVQSRDVRAIDSLYFRALALNPFVYRRFDHLLFDEYFEMAMRRLDASAGRHLDRSEARFEFDQEVDQVPALSAWLLYSKGQFPSAIQEYTVALARAKYKAGLLAARARASFLNGDYDAALGDLTAALQEERASDEKELVHFYDSKAVFEHSIGIIHEMRHELAAAREAYARALEEDLSYYQAHVRLAALALQAADTATAISEYDLAAELRADEPTVQSQLGGLLAATGKPADAVAHFQAAIGADSAFAAPYLGLAKAYEALGHPDSALAQYDAFVAHAARADAGLPFARARAETLRAAPPPEPRP
jgi:tetratricopeptide (TPR) repeat protein